VKIRNGICRAQIRARYQHTPAVLTVNIVNSALVAIVLASAKGQIYWLEFLALTVALTVVRAIGCACYRKCKEPDESTPKWALYATLGSGLSGLLWGAGSAFLLPDNLVEQTFLAFVIGGMCVASLVSFSYYLPAFIAYVFPASLPLAGRFFLDGWTVHGDMLVVFAVAITLAAYNSTGAFSDSLRLNLELTEKTEQLTATNHRLEMEISQRRATEDHLRQMQKMEAIGQLTGGIAHDFNNLLTAAALRAAERGAALTRHLLAFARRQRLEPRPVDVPAVISGAEKILNQTIGPEIRLVICTRDNLHPAWVDPNQLELAILNLALNARDAMRAGGRLCIDAENRRAEIGNLSSDIPPGDYVVVSVSDTGTGMNEETLARAFEPFFTTKEAGRGSGLGLSIVHGFAAQSGGSVQIASSPGQGTKVDLWLPRAKEGAVEFADVEPGPSGTEAIEGRILVCDDDADVLAFVTSILRDSGFTVWETVNPHRALEILEREWPIDLLLVDYAMPQMNGFVLIEQARVCQPGLRVLLMSGHADILHSGGAGGIVLLVKPFNVARLRQRIADALAESPGGVCAGKSDSPLLAVPK
jgi:signal transduction histidine kinase/ActR/RegA family two-component response regulator